MSFPNGENQNTSGDRSRKPENKAPAGDTYSQSPYRYYTGGVSGMPVENGRSGKRKIRWPIVISTGVIIAALIVGIAVLISSGSLFKPAPGNIIYTNQSPAPGGDTSDPSKYQYVASYADRYAPNVCIDGVEIGGLTRGEAIEKINQSIRDEDQDGSWSLDLVYNGHRYVTVTERVLGTDRDYDALMLAMDDAFAIGKVNEENGVSLDRAYDQLVENSSNGFFFDSRVSAESDLLDQYLSLIAENMYREPQNAYIATFNPQASYPFTIVDDVPGVRLDVERAKQEILTRAASGISGTYELIPDWIPASVTTNDVRNSVTLISSWTTNISSSSTENRNNNIALALSKVDGTVLENGATFSFNGVVGKRTTKAGFLEAAAYANNETVMQVGGGVCQASSTIYMAARLANLKIISRQPHSMAVNYTSFGLDATVNSDGKVIDMKFQNNTGGTIYICAGLEGKNKRTCYCRIYGPAMEPGVTYAVRTEEVETIIGADLEPVYKKDTEGVYGVTYTDEEILVKEAVDGHIVEAYLQKFQDGVLVEETFISRDEYPAQAAIYYRGVEKPPVFPEE